MRLNIKISEGVSTEEISKILKNIKVLKDCVNEIFLRVDSTSEVNELIDAIIDGLLRLRNTPFASPKCNPVIQEPIFFEEDCTGTIPQPLKFPKGSKVHFRNAKGQEESRDLASQMDTPLVRFCYDKLPDGTVNLEKHKLHRFRVQVQDQITKQIDQMINFLIMCKKNMYFEALLSNSTFMVEQERALRSTQSTKSNKLYHLRQRRKISLKKNGKNSAKASKA